MKKVIILFLVFTASALWAQVPPPTLISPADDYKNQNPPSSFSWNVAAGASGYRIGFSAYQNMSNPYPVSGILIGQTTWIMSSSDWASLPAGTQYYWSVQSYSPTYGLGDWQTSRKIMRLQSIIMSVSTSSISFGNVQVGSSLTQQFTITNQSSSSSNLVVTAGANLTSPFSVTNPGPHTLTPGQSINISVKFSPTSIGSYNQTLQISNNSTNLTNPYLIALSGTGTGVINMTYNPMNLIFGSVPVGQTSTKPLYFWNSSSSSGNLQITVPTLSAPFSVQNAGTYTIVPGGEKIIYVNFSPTSQGSYSNTLSITHNAGNQNNPLNIGISGTGGSTTVNMSISPQSLNYGYVVTNNYLIKEFTIKNEPTSNAYLVGTVGTNIAPPFSIVGTNIFNLAPNESQTFQIKFSPTSVNYYTLSLQISHNANNTINPATVYLEGYGVATPPINMIYYPSTVDFGTNIPINQTVTKTITFENNANSSGVLNITVPQLSAPFNIQNPGTYNISPGGQKIITATFISNVSGTFSNTLTVQHNATNQTQPLSIPFSGSTAQSPIINMTLTPSPLNFGNVIVGQTSDKIFTIRNESSSTGDLIYSPGLLDAPFTVINGQSGILHPGENYNVTVRYSPTSAITSNQNWSITNNSTNNPNPAIVSVSGTGILNQGILMTLSAEQINFGNVAIGQTVTFPFTISNSQNSIGSLNINLNSLSAPFSYTEQSTFTLNAGQSKTINIKFSPTALSSYNQTLNIGHNATNYSNNPVLVPILGTGVSSQITMIITGIINDSLKFGEIPLNQTGNKTISIKNAETSSGNLIIKLSSLATPFQQGSGTNNITIVPGETKNVNVTFTPNAVGTYNQNWTIEHNANTVESGSLLENNLLTEISNFIVKVNGICIEESNNEIQLTSDLTIYANNKQKLQDNYYQLSGNVNIDSILYFSGDVYVDLRSNLTNPEISGYGRLIAKNIAGQNYDLTIIDKNFKYIVDLEEENKLLVSDQMYLLPGATNYFGYAITYGNISFPDTNSLSVDCIFGDIPSPLKEIFEEYTEKKIRGRPPKHRTYLEELSASTIYSKTEGIDYACSISVDDAALTLGPYSVNSFTFYFNTYTNEWGGSLDIELPGKPSYIDLLKSAKDNNNYIEIPVEIINKNTKERKEIKFGDLVNLLNSKQILNNRSDGLGLSLEIEFVGINLNKLIIEVSGVNIPLWNTGLSITRIQGGLDDITTENWRLIANVDIETPDVPIFGPPLSIVDFGVKLGPPWYFKGSGTLQLFKNDLADAMIEHDGEHKKINVEGNLYFYEDLLTGGVKLSLTGSELTGSAVLSLKTPTILPQPFSFIQNQTLGSYENKFNLDKIDAFLPFGTPILFPPVILPIPIATRFTFNNSSFPYFHFNIGTNFDNLIQIFKTDKNSNIQRYFTVKDNTSKIMITSSNSQNLIDFTVVNPLNVVYDSTNAFYAKSSSTKQTIMIIDKPMKGNWIFSSSQNVDSVITLGLNQEPTPVVKSPGSKMSRSNLISLKINDFSDTVNVKVYYDDNNKNFDGIFIKQFQVINNANLNFTWQNDSIKNGEYYIYCEIDDGKNAPVYQYAPGSILIQNSNFNLIPANLSVIQSSDSSIKVSWTKLCDASIYATSVYFKDISLGKTEEFLACDTNILYAYGLKLGRKYSVFAAYLDTNYNKGPNTNSIFVVYKNHINNNTPYFTLESDKQYDFICNENKQYMLTGEDADGNSLTFSSPDLPSGAVISGNSLNWNPIFEQRGSHIVRLVISDGITSDTIKKQLNVFTQEQANVNLSFYSPTLYHNDNMAIKVYNLRATQDSLTVQIKNKRTSQQIPVICRRVDKFLFIGDFGLDHVAKSDLIVAQGDTILVTYSYLKNTFSDFSVYDTLYQSSDNTPPLAITDLQVYNEDNNFAVLNWTAPGDNGNTSNAFSYDIRYDYLKILNDTNFQNSHLFLNNMNPKFPGSPESIRINIKSLSDIENHDTIYFSIKSKDASGNTSDLSNCGTLGYVLNPDGLTAQVFDVYKIQIHIDTTNNTLKTIRGGKQGKSALMYYKLSRKYSESEFVLIKDSLLQTVYIDNLFQVSDGDFKYCVQAVYDAGVSDTLFSNSVQLDRFTDARILCTYSDSTSNENINLKLTGLDNIYHQTYNLITGPSGLLIIDGVFKSYYSVEMSKTGYPIITDTILIDDNNNQLTISPLLTRIVHLDAEWNLFSSPLNSKNMSVANMLPGTTAPVYGFTVSGYYPEDTIESGKGYWVRYDTNTNIQVKGIRIIPNYIQIKQGWNIIGPFDFSIPISNIVSVPPGIISSLYYEYSSGYGYDSVSVLEPGKGYWVYSEQNGILQIPWQNFKMFSLPMQSSNLKDLRIRLQFVDNMNRHFYLYLVPESETNNKYLLPPVSPSPIFDVRFASNKFIENKSIEQTVLMQYAEYPVKISAINLNGAALSIKDKINGKIVNKTLDEGAVLTINENIESLLILLNDLVPLEYDLGQNYPNPFNPVTNIKYQVPKTSIVKIIIYDILGREIKKLVDEVKEAGFYSLKFDAKDLSSGVYFYKMTAGDFNKVHKMVVVK